MSHLDAVGKLGVPGRVHAGFIAADLAPLFPTFPLNSAFQPLDQRRQVIGMLFLAGQYLHEHAARRRIPRFAMHSE